ncbi:hypothetical protein [Mongoliitalea daihaiensis]|uniref:hypothetical protein n=1 Tax=Mongoliitalea daihaiensis TaxID=2782006 RepID=UPI001F22A3E9|nr:hypothetical protein [Mongoliitalea daihaiensis]UJP63956.1 hypothetical protein IPZ59_14150 [Mongoliitalea daihaiensis]
MESEYNKIFELLYADYVYEIEYRRRRPFLYNEYYFVRSIRKSIDIKDVENTLRPDAKYFLIINFHHLIVRPLIERNGLKNLQNESFVFELEENIQSDIEMIINEVKGNDEVEQISGHQIMKSIDALWSKLRTTGQKTWG